MSGGGGRPGDAGGAGGAGVPDEGGPVAVLTGGARGIGAATARQLSAAGWRLVLVDACRDDPALDYALATRVELDAVVTACSGPERAVGVVGDVRCQDDLDAAAAAAVERFGGLDAAVAVAGAIGGGREAWRTDDATWAAMMGVNLEGVWRLAKATVPHLLERPAPRRGRFVAVSSAAGTTGFPLLAAYAASKHAVVGLVRSMAAELGPTGVTANVVAPGSTATAMLGASADVYGLASPADFAMHHPLGRLLDPDEVAALIAWVCGPSSSGVTGAVLAVDAGMSSS